MKSGSDYPRLLKFFDPRRIEAEQRAVDFGIVLAQGRAEPFDSTRRGAELRYDIGDGDRAGTTILDVDDVMAGRVVRVLEDLVDAVNRAAGHLSRLALCQSLVTGQAAGPFGAHAIDLEIGRAHV